MKGQNVLVILKRREIVKRQAIIPDHTNADRPMKLRHL